MQFDEVIRLAFKDIHVLLVAANTLSTRHLSDERTVTCLKGLLEKGSVRQALEKANDTALCFALREIKYVLNQRQTAKITINQLWRIIEQLDFTPGVKQQMMPQKKPPMS